MSRAISAPVGNVFQAVAAIEQYPETFPSETTIEFVGEQREGVGTCFKETRLRSGRDGTSEVEVTEFVDGDRIQLKDEAKEWSEREG